MDKITQDYGVVSYNIKDSRGQFTYNIKLSKNIELNEKTGYLYCFDSIVGNVGVQIYKGYELGFADGQQTVKVHRVKEYIFADDSLKSLYGKPVTLDHPTEMVNSENIKEYGCGTILDAGRIDGDNIICNLVIQDKELIDKMTYYDDNDNLCISDEYRDLSLGYSANLKPFEDSGEYVQTDIEYNHLAVVREGRADNAMIVDSKNKEIKEKKSMNVFDWLKGKKVKPHEDGSITILDEEEVVSKRETVTKEEFKNFEGEIIKEETKVTSVRTKDKDEKAKIEVEKEGDKKNMKDKAYYRQAIKDAMELPEGAVKADLLDELNTEFLDAFPVPKEIVDKKLDEKSVLDKIEVVDSKLLNKDFDDEKPEFVDFNVAEKESKLYYDKLSNPESGQHESHEAWSKFYRSEVRSGKANLNL